MRLRRTGISGLAIAITLICTIVASQARPAEAATAQVRLAVLKFGTVSWVLDVIKHHGLDRDLGFELIVTPYAGTQATKVALQAGAADIIVSDWLWVSRRRRSGADFVFHPYSTAVGAIMVPATSTIRSLVDLKGKAIGVAGGPLDKSWLILNAFAEKQTGLGLRKATQPIFGAPPLLAHKTEQGELDAVLNYWHYCARLEAKGMRRLIEVQTAARGLGASADIPMIGYVFTAAWAKANPALARAFLQATERANNLLMTSDAEWERLRPLMRVKSGATWRVLRDRYREGIPDAASANSERDVSRLFTILARIGGDKLVGSGTEPAPGTFWTGSQ